MANPSQTNNKNQAYELRRRIKQQRAQLSAIEQFDLSFAICAQLSKSSLLLKHTYIAAYLPDRGEVQITQLFEQAWRRGKHIFLPVLDPIQKHKMHFVEYRRGDPLTTNRFGMLEPILGYRNTIPSRLLSLVLCPLVAFDKQARRIGMGGGFYDRHFAFKQQWPNAGPKLVGLAYEFQKVEHIETAPWDVPLDAVISEQAIYASDAPRKNC